MNHFWKHGIQSSISSNLLTYRNVGAGAKALVLETARVRIYYARTERMFKTIYYQVPLVDQDGTNVSLMRWQ